MSFPFLSFHMVPFQSESIFSRFSGGRMLGFSRSPGEYMECDLWLMCHWCHISAKRTRLRNLRASWGRSWSGSSTFSWTFSWKQCDFSLPSTSFFNKKHANFASKNPAVVKFFPRKFHPKKNTNPWVNLQLRHPHRWTMWPRCRRSESWSYTLELSLLGVAVREIFGEDRISVIR